LEIDHIFKPYKNQVSLCSFSFNVGLMSMMIGEQENYLYMGTDGIYFNIRSDGVKQYILVIIGVASRSNKVFFSIEYGYR